MITSDSLSHGWAGWFPDGKKLVFVGAEPGHANRSWRQDLDGGKPVAITPEGVTGIRISPDGRTLAAVDTATPDLALSDRRSPSGEARGHILTRSRRLIDGVRTVILYSSQSMVYPLRSIGLIHELVSVNFSIGPARPTPPEF